MGIRDHIRDLSVLPPRLDLMLEQALLAVENTEVREDLCTVACVVSNATWQQCQARRLPEDSRQEHEWVVFANVMRIAESEKLPLEDRRIATAFCFVHDTFFIKRIMEEDIRKLEADGQGEQAARLRTLKKAQRDDHMKGSAANARALLEHLEHPATPGVPLLSAKDITRCVDIVAEHDSWKVDPPKPPPTEDRLALACVEGDALWPLHPIGVLADLERPNPGGHSTDMFDPSQWRNKLTHSLRTLVDPRSKWEGIPDSDFIDTETIFRTQEGHRLYSKWRGLWGL